VKGDDLANGAVERFRAVLGRRFGLAFEDSRLLSLAELLRRRAAATPGGIEAILAGLEGPAPWREELRLLAQEITVPETYFFRNADQFRALLAVLGLDGASVPPGARTLRVLSLGCASGEEPYSIAILLRACVDAGWNVSIRGVDLNPAVLAKATGGRYTSWALRDTTPDLRARWFRSEGKDFVLDDRVRAMVTFEERNLTEDDPAFWRQAPIDVVFCRNVIMYLTSDAARALIARITAVLAPGGFLFLGHAETLRGLSHDFHLCHTHETFYYQRRATSARPDITSSAPEPGDLAAAVVLPIPAEDWAESWVETVRRATERIAALATRPLNPIERAPRGTDVGHAFELMGQERFAEAQEVVGSLSADDARDPDILLLRAVLLTHGGDLTEAERVSSELLAMDEMNAGAHYVMALCRESNGDTEGAREQDRLALYLDPRFAMPRFHLGLLARRAGDVEAARHELALALVLLEREDAPRVLLFGGGFRREALVAVCRAELVACGGAS
jgi:chemotaxis protein methyltransferase CheR